MFLRTAYQWRYSNIINIMLLTISLNINNTLCYIICWHVFVRNIVTSICKITTSSCIIGLTKVFICLIVAPINGLNLVLHFFRQELNSFLLMPFTILVPNTYAFRPKRTASLYLVYPGIRFLLCSETPSVALSRNWFITGVGLLLRIVHCFLYCC